MTTRHELGLQAPVRSAAALPGRRRVFFSTLFGLLGVGLYILLGLLAPGGITLLEACLVLLFALAFGYIAYASVNAGLGFALRLLSRDPLAFAAPPLARAVAVLPPERRVAVVMPVYNEDVDRVLTGLGATVESLAALPNRANFEVHLLSDSTDDAIAAAEREGFERLRARFGDAVALHYRRRPDNTGAKVGNIAEFCERAGDHYSYMVVLDADSIMSGTLVDRLARVLEGAPEVGILQTVPLAVEQTTGHGRLAQFTHRLTAEMLCLGQCWWQGGNGLYFGHNAIIRLAPFREHCQLPRIRGRHALAGHVLSHDFVEAALMRAAGYEVWHVPLGDGSYEQLPTNVIDLAARERRWCHGCLQHLFLLHLPRLTWLSRVQLVVGAMSYICSAAWFATLCVAVLLAALQYTQASAALEGGLTLIDETAIRLYRESVSLCALTIVLLLLPKLLAGAWIVASRARRQAYGGVRALGASMAIEAVYSALLAPVMMLLHVRFMVALLAGRQVQWTSQSRDGRDVPLRAACTDLASHLACGGALALLLWSIKPSLVLWFSPVLAGLLLAPLLVSASSRHGGWRRARQLGLLRLPEDRARPTELDDLARLERQRAGWPVPSSERAPLAADAGLAASTTLG